MKHVFRFFAAPDPQQAHLWRIVEAELKHLKQVCRLKVGDSVEVTDGMGRSGVGTIAELSSDGALIAVPNAVSEPRSPDRIFILSALDHHLIDEWIPELTELGFTAIGIYRQAGQPAHHTIEKVVSRRLRLLESATKQCKRSYLPQLLNWSDVASTVEFVRNFAGKKLLLSGEAPSIVGAVSPGPVLVVCGNEAGLSESDARLFLEAGCLPASLGSHVLRARTAVLASAALVACLQSVPVAASPQN